MTERENYFILLGLDPETDVWPAIERRILERKQVWELEFNQGNPRSRRQARRCLDLLPHIEATLRRPETRVLEAREARKLLQQARKEELAALDETVVVLRSGSGTVDSHQLKAIEKRFAGTFTAAEIRQRLRVSGIGFKEASQDKRGASTAKQELDKSTVSRTTIDKVTARTIRQNLDCLGLATLYELLELGAGSSPQALADRAKEMYRGNMRLGKTDADATACNELAGICKQVFKNDQEKAKYDAFLVVEAMENLHDNIELAGGNGYLTQEQLSVLVEQGMKRGVAAAEARAYIEDYGSGQGWVVQQTAAGDAEAARYQLKQGRHQRKAIPISPPPSVKHRDYLELSFEHHLTARNREKRYLLVTLSGSGDLLPVPYRILIDLPELAPQLLTQLGEMTRNLCTAGCTEADQYRLRSLGSDLTRGLLPEPILQALAEGQFPAGTPLHIESEDAWAPWEIAWFRSGFLGEHFAVTRSLRHRALRRHRIVGDRAVLVTSGHGDLRVHQERKALQRISGSQPSELQELLQIQRLMEANEPIGFLHFACHGTAMTKDPAGGRLELRGDALREIDVQPLSSGRPNGPLVNALVMLNACQAGIPGINLCDHGGWAKRFLEAGAAVFIAPSWSVGDTAASTFADSFYAHLQTGITAGEAARLARLATKEAGGAPDHLAYAVYAAPETCLKV